MTLYCPVTGFKVSTNPEWTNQDVSDTFSANFWIINNSIIYSLPQGYADLTGVRSSISLNDRVASFVSEGNGPYVQIEDYMFLAGSNLASRRYFTSKMNNDKRRLSLIFCNLSQPLSIAVKIGKRFNTTGKYIHVVRHYSDAIQLALKLGNQNPRKNDIAPIDLFKCFGRTNRILSPVEVLADKAWNFHTSEFSNRMVLINQHILHSTTEGHIKSKHIPHIEHARFLCQLATTGSSGIKYIVVDSSRLKAGSRSARALYMKSLKKWHQRFPLNMYVVYGANTFMKTALHLARPLMPFKVKIAKDIEHAFQLIHDDRPQNAHEKNVMHESEKPAVVVSDDIEKLMAFIGSINWEREGIEDRFQMDEDHPLYYLYQSIKLIKEELDDLFRERKHFEEQLHQSRKMESMGTLAGGIAHEFNNLLGIIIGNTELALDDVPHGNPAKDCLEEIRIASSRANEVVKQILSFARKTPTTRKPIRISNIIKESLKLTRATVPTTIEIRQEILCNSEMILANPTEIHQILMNLCSNSVQAMQEETGILVARLEATVLNNRTAAQYENLTGGEYIKLVVKDNGKGIKPEIMDRIFDPYFTTKEIGKGLGMGLSVVYGIVKKHDGAIKVSSEAGKGTTVEVLFPISEARSEIEVKEPENLPKGTERILVVDDEASLVKTVKQLLKRQGYEVIAKTSSTEALKLFQKKSDKFDLIFTDMGMPKIPGNRLAKEFIKIRPDIPIILCTGHSELIDDAKTKELGIKAYTMKPLMKSDLVKTVRKVLDEAKGLTQALIF